MIACIFDSHVLSNNYRLVLVSLLMKRASSPKHSVDVVDFLQSGIKESKHIIIYNLIETLLYLDNKFCTLQYWLWWHGLKPSNVCLNYYSSNYSKYTFILSLYTPTLDRVVLSLFIQMMVFTRMNIHVMTILLLGCVTDLRIVVDRNFPNDILPYRSHKFLATYSHTRNKN